MSDFETKSTLDSEGGEEMPMRPAGFLGGPIPVPYGRDVQTDARRMGEVDGSGGNIMDDRDLDDVGYLMNTGVSTIANEVRSAGWEKNTLPSGALPRPLETSGSRGADDIGKL